MLPDPVPLDLASVRVLIAFDDASRILLTLDGERVYVLTATTAYGLVDHLRRAADYASSRLGPG